MPVPMATSKSEVSMPRHAGGDSSAAYSGPTTKPQPTPRYDYGCGCGVRARVRLESKEEGGEEGVGEAEGVRSTEPHQDAAA